MQQRALFCVLFGLMGFFAAHNAVLGFNDEEVDNEAFFEKQVRPLLADHCLQCHSGAEAARGLRLDSPEGFRTDDGQGMVVVPGDPGVSRLIRAVEHHASSAPMPPDGRLQESQIADLKRWIASGANWPEGKPLSTHPGPVVSDHWSFQPLRRKQAPRSTDDRWNRHFIDRWVEAQRASVGLSPSSRATPTELARRVAMDLTGLPPDNSIAERLAESDDLEVIEEIVEELLNSEAYGQHWGRHWLDVARYSEMMGVNIEDDEQDKNPFAYTYRDWVIEAFNQDLAYDRFVELQLAADYVRPESDPDLAALGFLTVGNKFEGDEPNLIDDRLDTIFRGTQGLTISCARCHDHKYDPVPTQDYYALYGVFSEGSEKEIPIFRSETDREVLEVYRKKLRDATNAFERHKRDLRIERYQTPYTKMTEYFLAASQESDPASDERGWRNDGLHQSIVTKVRQTLTETQSYHHSVFALWNRLSRVSDEEFGPLSDSLAEAYRRHLRADSETESESKSGTEANADEESAEEPQDEDNNIEPINARIAREFVAKPPRNRTELAQLYGAILKQVALDWLQQIERAESDDVDPPESLPDESEDEIRRELFAEYPSLDVSDEDLMNLLEEDAREKFDQLAESIAEIRNAPDVPPHARIFVDGNPEREQYVFIRGKQDRPGDRVLPKFVSILSHDDTPFSPTSSRLELARSIIDPHNPLTARVWVNRVWDHLMGRGIVDTTSDFGIRGSYPSHPELLDALALDFIKNGWSTKSLIRKIVLSETYLQSSRDRQDAMALDPENRWLWRMNRKRLSKEAVRDSVLYVAGQLDMTHGGVSLPVDELDFEPRRTVYFSIHRRQLDPMSLAFDMPSPALHSPRRYSTTLPQQALYMLNNPLVIEASRSIADALWDDSDVDSSIRNLYLQIVRREPEDQEIEIARSFFESEDTVRNSDVELTDSEDESDDESEEPILPLSSAAKLAQILLMSNEFIYID
jgi:hypothetical protein